MQVEMMQYFMVRMLLRALAGKPIQLTVPEDNAMKDGLSQSEARQIADREKSDLEEQERKDVDSGRPDILPLMPSHIPLRPPAIPVRKHGFWR